MLKDFIRTNMPKAWSEAALDLRMKTELIQRLRDSIPSMYRNNRCNEHARRLILQAFKSDCNIIHLVDATDINLTKWAELNAKIKEYAKIYPIKIPTE